jgi:hypothetical protein
MKNKDIVVQKMLVILCELEAGTAEECGLLWSSLVARLETIVDILDDDLPYEYYDRVSEYIF